MPASEQRRAAAASRCARHPSLIARLATRARGRRGPVSPLV